MSSKNPLERVKAPDDGPPPTELDVVDEAVNPPVNDEFLDQFNLGLGNYSSKEYWQQVESFKRGLYADAAFSRRIVERAIEETMHGLATQGWEYAQYEDGEVVATHDWDGFADADPDLSGDPAADEPTDRRQWIEQVGPQRWAKLDEDGKLLALEEFAGLTKSWTPPHWRMLKMRHEASRSRGARLLDNLFGRVKQFFGSKDGSGADDELKLER